MTAAQSEESSGALRFLHSKKLSEKNRGREAKRVKKEQGLYLDAGAHH